MSSASRFVPLRPLFGARLRPLDTEPWSGRLPADPQRAWQGRTRLDRARVELRPEDADAWWRLGVGLSVLGRHRDASAAFLRTLRRDTLDPPRAQLLVLDDGPASPSLRREILHAVEDTTSVQLLWICTRPVDFEDALKDAEAFDGRIYRIDTPLLEPLLAHFPMPRVGLVLARNAASVRNLPPRVRRVRIPGALVESCTPEFVDFDALLCPSRVSARAWQDFETVCVAWPHVDDTRAIAADDVVIEMNCAPDHPAAWSDAAVIDLIERLTLELPEITVAVRPVPTRRAQALRLWKQWKPSAVDGTRVRIDLQRSNTAGHVVVTEAPPEAWAAHLRTPRGLIVLDPRSVEPGDEAPVTVDTALQVVEALHARRAGSDGLDVARDRARGRILFLEDDPDVPRLSRWIEATLEPVPPKARRASEA